MTATCIVCLLLSTQMCAQAAPGEIQSSALLEVAETAQRNRSACGPLAVWYALARLGHPTDVDELIASAGLSKDGTTIRRLLELVAEHGCSARAISTQKERLELLPVPSILLVDKGLHCIVYDGLDEKGECAKIFETMNRKTRLVEVRQLRRAWTGEAIIFDDPHPSPYAFCAMCVLAMSIVVAPAACLVFRRGRNKVTSRAGFTMIELLVAIGVMGVLFAMLVPAVQHTRESSRTTHCRANLHQLGIALQNYELHYRVFPSAVVWKPAGEPLGQGIAPPGSIDRVSLGIATPLAPDRVYANWAIATLPFLGEDTLYQTFDLTVPLGDPSNATARAVELPVMRCPTDASNGVENHFQRAGLGAADQGYARGNYAINGGTSRRCLTRLSARNLECNDGVMVDGSDLRVDTSQVWGNGVAGVNRSMRQAEFIGGLSRLVLVEEIRAGVHPLDRRGVWALGFAGSSVTACHGLYGNLGPNKGKDVIQGCTETLAYVTDLDSQGMPCLQSRDDSRLEISERATARSMHDGGVNLLMADGSSHFVTDLVDKRVWHGLHKRDNQQPIDF